MILAFWGWLRCLCGRHRRGAVHYVRSAFGIMVPVKRCVRCKKWY